MIPIGEEKLKYKKESDFKKGTFKSEISGREGYTTIIPSV